MESLHAFLAHKAYCLRVSSLIEAGAAGSGHPTTCLSAADIVAVLFFKIMHFDPDNFENNNNDRFILSKGHASALLYAVWKELGKLSQKDLLTYRKFDSVLEGHPTFRFPYTEAATGSLGIGLSIGIGIALAARLDQRSFITYVLLGDAEMAEGSIWEAIQLASFYKLSHLVAIVDFNQLGQSCKTMVADHPEQLADRVASFGWKTYVVDGHSSEMLVSTLLEAIVEMGKNQAPVMIVAKTIKGYGLPSVAGKFGFHGKPFLGKERDAMLAELATTFKEAAGYNGSYLWQPIKPQSILVQSPNIDFETIEAQHAVGDMVPTRRAYGEALALCGGLDESIVSLDADVKNSTYAELFEKRYPNRFIQSFIAEQNMVSMGVGMARCGKKPFISTFAAFFTRAHDQIRMAAIGISPLRLVGSHAGVSIGEDGPSQMGLEDIAQMRGLPGSVVLYPCDAVSTHYLVQEMVRYESGISYLRTTRAATPVIYKNNEKFVIGGSKVLKQSDHDQVCIIASGITVFEALKAYDILQKNYGILSCIIDLYSIKPFDTNTVRARVRHSKNRVIVVEDHYAAGGIGEMIAAELCGEMVTIKRLAVLHLPRSGTPEELLHFESIDAESIVCAAQELLMFNTKSLE